MTTICHSTYGNPTVDPSAYDRSEFRSKKKKVKSKKVEIGEEISKKVQFPCNYNNL